MVQSIDDARRRQARPSGGGRVPPHNLAAEESLLGAMLLSRDAISTASMACAADDFYKPAHAHIFDAVLSLHSQGEAVDAVTVADELGRAGLLEAIGGPSVLVNLQANTPATSNAGSYAKIVEEHALLRRLIGVAGEIAELGYAVPDDVEAAVDRAESLVFEVADRRVTDTTVVLRDLLYRSLERIEALFDRGEDITGVPTGYLDIDEKLSGLQPSSLVIVGARPAMGKTAFALGMASHAAVRSGVPVLFFSLEMGHLEITQRLLCSEAMVESSRLRNGRLLESDWPRITAATSRLGEAPLYVDDNPNLTIMEVRAKARRLKSKLGTLGLIVIDYLQLMTGRHNAENRQVEIAEMSRGLKILARELEVPVVALSQLSRQLESRADKRPMLSDLRESGCLTADTRVLRADTGAEVTMGELLVTGERDVPVWTVDHDLKVVPGTMTAVFPSGIKPVFSLQLASGRTVKATANHPFLTVAGWRRLDELEVGGRVAVPRTVPAPRVTRAWRREQVVLLAHLVGDCAVTLRRPLQCRTSDRTVLAAVRSAARAMGAPAPVHRQGNWLSVQLSPVHPSQADPVWEWLRDLGLAGLRGRELFVPGALAQLPRRQLALFLRHLWASGGKLGWQAGHGQVSFTATSRRLAEGIQGLLNRFGIWSRLTEVAGDHHGAAAWQVAVVNPDSQRRFLDEIGAFGCHVHRVPLLTAKLPVDAGRSADTSLNSSDPAGPDLDGPDLSDDGSVGRVRMRPSVGVVKRLAGGLVAEASDPRAAKLATADVLWDRIIAIEPLGDEPVYDATVPGTHNFIANGITVHNSLEQDADVVMFIYRDEIYNAETNDKGAAEIILAKHRNGPTGTTKLVFQDRYTRFDNAARGI
ncbi:MAG: replicative DNA helicase [Acidimicrobiales bacterium]